MKINKLAFISLLIGSIFTAQAAINFEEPYLLTLNELHDADSIKYPISSGYALTFTRQDSPTSSPKNYTFINYVLESGNSITPIYYIINPPSITASDKDLLRISDTTSNLSPIGYFKRQSVVSTEGGASPYKIFGGGAIFNINVMGDIIADFIENSVTSSYTYNELLGGAIYNSGTIGNIFGDFVGNYVASTASSSYRPYGGAIYNTVGGRIGDIEGNFINNRSSSGGAIYNLGTINKITGDFIANYSTQSSNWANPYGGAIYNTGIIGGVDGNFIGNYASVGQVKGGAICTMGGTIGNINADFIDNYINSTYSAANNGGAVYIENTIIGNLTGNFIGNYINSTNNTGRGGGLIVYTGGTVGNIDGNFIENYVSAGTSAYGGAVAAYNGKASTITADFVRNYVLAISASAEGGAVWTNGTGNFGVGAGLTGIIGDFTENYASAGTTAYGGAVHNQGRIGTGTSGTGIIGDFTGNYAYAGTDAWGGAIYNTGTIGSGSLGTGIIGDFTGNYVSAKANAYGGAIYTTTLIGNYPSGNGISGNFLNNYATTTSTTAFALGGAIYTTNHIFFSANGLNNEFTGNYTKDSTGKTYNALYINGSGTRYILLNPTNSGSITFNDTIRGNGTSVVDLYVFSDTTGGTVNLNAETISVSSVNVSDSILTLGSYDHNDSTATNNKTNGLFWASTSDKTTPFTSLNLENASLVLKYDLAQNNGSYQNLILKELVSVGTANSLSFSANFGDASQGNGYGLSDKITIANNVSGTINLSRIDLSGTLAVGNQINLFGNLGVVISNINEYSLVYGGQGYVFEQLNDNKDLRVRSNELSYIIYVPTAEVLDFQSTTVDNASDQGVIYNYGQTTISNGIFTNNANSGNPYTTAGNGGVLANFDDMTVIDSDFNDNATANGLGGAIYSESNLTIEASDNKYVTFANNTDTNGANDIYMGAGSTLILKAGDNGNININSGLSGDIAGYTLSIDGNENGNININSIAQNITTVIMNGGNLYVANPSDLDNINLVLNDSTFGLMKNIIDDIILNDLTGGNGSVWLDVNPDTLTSDIIKVNGDLSGTVRLTLNALSQNQPNDKILFAETINDNVITSGGFEIYRVINSPYTWTAEFDGNGRWYLPIPTESNNNGVVAEVISYIGLHSATIEQTRSMVNNIKNKATANKILLDYNGFNDKAYDKKTSLYNVWVAPIYFNSTIKVPVSIESDIVGLEAGFDIKANQNHKLGVFASYRKGDYDLNGEGKQFYSDTGSTLDIDSYIGGLYYLYEREYLWVFATSYGGVQSANIETNDAIKADTDGTQIGGDIEVGYMFKYTDTIKLEPIMGVSYTMVDANSIKDDAGKTAKYDTISQTELEASFKMEKHFYLEKGIAKIYIKPSIIQIVTSGDSVLITGIDEKISTYNDGTLGRFEIGGTYSITKQLSTYGFITDTFGSDYNATSLGIGLNFAW